MNYPQKARPLKVNDAKLGGKYRMNNIREFISLLYLLYVTSGRKSTVNYSDGETRSNSLFLSETYQKAISNFLATDNLNEMIVNNPLLTGQFEYILVAMERIFSLGSVKFNNSSLSNSKERTGGIRYPKTLVFSTNIIILDLILTGFEEKQLKSCLIEWLQNKQSNNKIFEDKITQYLTISSEFSLYKVRISDDEEVVYRSLGIYEEIKSSGSVSIADYKEQVGTSSIYSNVLKEGLNPWLDAKSVQNIVFNKNKDISSYYEMLKTTLDIDRINDVDTSTQISRTRSLSTLQSLFANNQNINILSAIRTKPFILLAGISGTGKSRIVRKLAQASITEHLQRLYDHKSLENGFNRWGLHKPANFELIQVKPNWHNSMDVVGYKSNIGGSHYEFTPFVEFIAKAWLHQDTPFFLCLDEMNLAPVEQYFAEFLSAIESRSIENDKYITDPIVKPFESFDTKDDKGNIVDKLSDRMIAKLIGALDSQFKSDLAEQFTTKGLTLPKNLIVMGTVNMDETTFSFSRKVLDRAMSIEMNKVCYEEFFNGTTEDDIPELSNEYKEALINRPLRGLSAQDNDAESVKEYLTDINIVLDKTPFQLGYRVANEALLYVSAAKTFGCYDTKQTLDEFTLMKILSRIEGDKRSLVTKDGKELLPALKEVITSDYPLSNEKLGQMIIVLNTKQFVSYWT